MNAQRWNREELRERFGISARLAARIGALYSQRLAVSEALLEMAGPGSAIEAVLLDRALLSKDAPLDATRLAAIAGDSGEELALLPAGEDWRQLALAEEALADVGFGEPSPAAEADPAPAPAPAPAPEPGPAPAPEPAAETRALAVPGEAPPGLGEQRVAEAKLTLATSADPAAKTEALRLLQLAPIDSRELGGVLVAALRDEFAEVRGEAARAFARLGVDQDLADACAKLLSGDAEARRYAAARLIQLAGALPEAQRPLLVAVLLRALASGLDPEVRGDVFDALTVAWPEPSEPPLQEELLRALLPPLAADIDGLAGRVRRLLLRVAAASADLDGLALTLELESDRAVSQPLSRYLLSIAGELELAPERRQHYARRLADKVDRGVDLDPVYLRLEAALTSLGSFAIEPLVARLKQTRDVEARVLLVNLLDVICAESKLKPAELNSVLEVMLSTYQVAAQRAREAVINVQLFGEPRLGKRLRRRMAYELLIGIHQWRLQRVVDDISDAVTRLGAPAVDACVDVLEHAGQAEVRERVGRIIGELCEQLPGDADGLAAARKGLEFCAREIANPERQDKGELITSWGRIASRGDLDHEEVAAVIEGLRERIWGSSYTYKVLEGLGWAAASPAAPDEAREEVTGSFIGLLNERLPGAQGHARNRHGEQVFFIGHETTVYTELIPALLAGLAQIHGSSATPDALRETISRALIDKWRQLVAGQVIWGPMSTIRLGELVAQLGAHPETPSDTRLASAEALFERVDNTSVAAALASYATLEPKSKPLDKLLADVADQTMDLAADPGYQDDEDQRQLLTIVTRLLERSQLGASKSESNARKRRALQLLYDGARRQLPGAVSLLEELAGSEHLQANLKDEINERLPAWATPV